VISDVAEIQYMPSTTETIDPLTRLAIKHGTDKWGPHFYTPVYHDLFSHLRDKPVRLLEIGIGGYAFKSIGGASLAMWADYFPKGQIVGIDIAEKKLDLDPRISIHQGSQDDPAFLKRVCEAHGPFDIIIDDGSHVPTHVVASFYALFPQMADNGIYVIEDVQTCFWPSFGGSILDGGKTMKLAMSMLEYLNFAEIQAVRPELQMPPIARHVRSLRAYHNLLVIEKGDNSEPSNANYKPDQADAVRALRLIEQELEQSPTPEGFANLINIYCIGRNCSKAMAVARDALGKWPDNPTLLLAAFHVAAACKELREKLSYIERLCQIEPQIAKPLLEQTRTEISRSQTIS
jgi:hypothetical protein